MKRNCTIRSAKKCSEPSSAVKQDHVLKLLRDAISDWHCDYNCDPLSSVILSASTLEPIFALLRHNNFSGSLIVGFYDGVPFSMVGRSAEDSFEDTGDDTFRIKP